MVDFGNATLEKASHWLKGTNYKSALFLAPEIFKGEDYTEKADVWALGVIAYSLIAGRFPFDGLNNDDIVKNIKAGKLTFEENLWAHSAPSCKALISAMLSEEPELRPSAAECFSSDWVQKKSAEESDYAAMKDAFESLSNHNAQHVLQRAGLTYIASHLTDNEEVQQMKQLFTEFDANGDGTLSKEEITYGYYKLYGDCMDDDEIDKIFSMVDKDSNGKIEYTEWVTAQMSLRSALSDQKLKLTFDMFDRDKSGTISAPELKQVLGVGNEVPEEYWEQLVIDADPEGKGAITFDAFKTLMMELLKAK